MYNYAENVKRYELLDDALRRADMAGDVHAQSYQLSFNFSEPSDPVAAHTDKIISLETQIKRLERSTKPITRLIREVDKSAGEASEFSAVKDFQALLNFYYFGGCTLYDIADITKKSRRTLSSRRRKLVLKAADYLGL